MDTFKYIVNKYKIDVARQYFIDIPQMIGSADLVKLFAELGFTKGVEIGVDRGLFSEYMMQNIPNLKLYGVDPWTTEVYDSELSGIKEEQPYWNTCYEETLKRVAPYPNYTVVKKTSLEALADFEDNSLDFVYIDGNHDFLNVIQDVQGWLKKVRPGGILSGHDYVKYSYRKFNHVKRALEAYAVSYRMLPIFAVMYTATGMKRDKYRSWFYCKP